MVKVSAPGKVIISGEHSIVYGQPALLAAIDKRCWITVQKSKSGQLKISDRMTNDLRLARLGVKEACQVLSVDKSQLDIVINNQVPLASGLGSSAALSVSLTAGIWRFFNPEEKLDKTLINQIAFRIEKYQHGNPSGGDNAVCTYGGWLTFQKKNENREFKSLDLDQSPPEFLLVDTGRPVETTGQMVAAVRQKYQISKTKYQKIFKKIGQVTEEIIKCFKKRKLKEFKSLIIRNQRLLEELGVVGKKAKVIIQLIEIWGGAAKVCGAGGVKRGSGFALAYSDNLNLLAEKLRDKKIEFIKVKLGGVGVKIH